MVYNVNKRDWGDNPDISGPKDWFRNSLLIKEIKKRKKSGYVLDFGCGKGELLFRLAGEGFICTGIDSSKVTVADLRKKIRQKSLSSKILDVKSGNENTICKLKKKFDIVVAGEVLEHIENDRKLINLFYRVLKKNGICVVTVPANSKHWDINDEYSGHCRRYNREELKLLIDSAGFKTDKIFYWGFPAGLIWHKFIFLNYIKKQVISNNTGKSFSILAKLSSVTFLKRLIALIFIFDALFNWTKMGGGLFLIARKE